MNASTPPLVELIAALEDANRDVFTTRCMTLAGFVVLIYDHLLTFGDEVDLIWSKGPSLISALFLLNRYLVPMVLATDIFVMGGLARNLSNNVPSITYFQTILPSTEHSCEGWLFFEGYIQIISYGVAHGLIALRVRAIWGRNKIITSILAVAFLAYFSATMALATLAGIQLKGVFHWDATFNTCFAGRDRFTLWIWVPALAFETILFGLTLLKAVRFSFGIVTTMSSKLVLNLRSLGREDDPWLTDLSAMQFELNGRNTDSYWDPNTHEQFDVEGSSTRAAWMMDDPYTSLTGLNQGSIASRRMKRLSAASRESSYSRRHGGGRPSRTRDRRPSYYLHPGRVVEIEMSLRVPDRVRLSRIPTTSTSLLGTYDTREER
ncbi:hypothetical protein FRB97_002022 [Tulasnella sp. 331]|nr:hypothetical protein FRB97_002022 [Tulasnella sp. 331]